MSSHPAHTPDHLQGPMAEPTPLGRDESTEVYRCRYCLEKGAEPHLVNHKPGCKHPEEAR